MDSNEVRRQWADRTGAYSPEYYAHHGPDERSESVYDILTRFLDRDARVLELGCSSGRHLAHLADQGFDHLAGIEVNDDAFDVMAETYPDLAASGTFYRTTIEEAVVDLADGAFDAVYSVETLQHLHPDAAWVFGELARVADDLVVTVENEGDGDDDVNYVDGEFPLYYRDWGRVFTDLGLTQVSVSEGKRDTTRAFRWT